MKLLDHHSNDAGPSCCRSRMRACALMAVVVLAGLAASGSSARAAGCGDRHYMAPAGSRGDVASLSWLRPASGAIGPLGRIDDEGLPWTPSPCAGLRCGGDPAPASPVVPPVRIDTHRLDSGAPDLDLDPARDAAGERMEVRSSRLPTLHLASRLDRPPR